MMVTTMARVTIFGMALLSTSVWAAPVAPPHRSDAALAPLYQQASTKTAEAREGIFVLNAARATIVNGELMLQDVEGNTFAFEPDAKPPVGVTEDSERFLSRWASVSHSIHPAAFLTSPAVKSDDAYRSLSMQIDKPRKSDSGKWIFEIDAIPGRERDFPAAALDLTNVTLTVVMDHSPEEFARGHVCGPWNPDTLMGHVEVSKQ